MYILLGLSVVAMLSQNPTFAALLISMSLLMGAVTASIWDQDLIATVSAVFALFAMVAFAIAQLWVGAGLAALCVLFSLTRFSHLRVIAKLGY